MVDTKINTLRQTVTDLLQLKAAILDAILKITLFWLPDDNLTGLNGFLDSQNHSVDIKFTTLRQTVADLLQF